MKMYLLSLLVILFTTSCAKTYYGVSFVDCPPQTDTNIQGPEIRIINAGRTGFSSIGLETEKGVVKVCGVKPGDTSKYFKLSPFCYDIKGAVTVLKVTPMSRPYGGTIFTGRSPDGPPCKRIVSGQYSLIIQVKGNGRKIDLSEWRLVTDKN